MINKKAQTATEYMIILAVVIIIALIVVGVLGGIPGIGGGAGSRALDAYWSTAPIGVVSAAASVNHNARLIIKNNLNDPIMINEVKMSSNGQSPADHLLNQTLVTMGIGEEKVWNVTTNNATHGVPNICNQAGDAWISNIYINYTNQRTGATYEFRGEGNQLSGVCATSISN